MRLRPTQDQLRGLDDGLSRAIELVVTPLVFAGIGYLLDGWLGIRPALTIVFGLWALVGVSVRMWYSYEADMRQHEAELALRRRGPAASTDEVDR